MKVLTVNLPPEREPDEELFFEEAECISLDECAHTSK